ncbi:MAG: helix-hairpin-helix domain-containing protein [Bacteroidetes bacterium]|nr:helix-hairpin-helix domain-containing protein [Bacteroidota bacterium]MCL5025077.1 helix-hairpin-helix domain-containing protein [Chloroflexota bacterium]
MSEPGDRTRIVLSLALVALVAAGAVAWLDRRSEAHPLAVTTPTVVPTAEASIKVYVSGAVGVPGVLEMRPGQRVEDALSLAGGPLPDAELDGLNLAARVRDEQHINVPRQGERPPTASEAAAGGKLDLNTATLAELDRLPGVGPVTAEKIMSYRREKGRFQRVDELLEAKLLNQRTFEAVKGLVTVQP